MFEHHYAMVYHTPETALIHKEKEEDMAQRRSVFLPPEIVRDEPVPARFTCRDADGNPRLRYGVNLMDAIDQLCRIEERSMGVMIQGRTENQEARAEETRKRRREEQKRDKAGTD